MPQRLLLGSLAAFSLALFGCMQPSATTTPAAVAGEGTVTATAHLAIADQAGRRLMAPVGVLPWAKGDIEKVNVSLYKVGDATALITQDIAKENLEAQITFTNLHQSTNYKVEVKAWAAGDERIDNFDVDASSCTTVFGTSNLVVQPIDDLKLKLRNKIFSGNTTGSTIDVEDGDVENTTTPASMTITVLDPS